MVEDVFQCNDEPPTLKEKVVGIIGETFGVADGVEEEANRGHDHAINIGEDPMEIGVADEIMGEVPLEMVLNLRVLIQQLWKMQFRSCI